MYLFILAAAAAVVVFPNLLVIAYRLIFHPLARYPGRFWDRVSAWPRVFYCWKGNRHIKQYLAHQKYGSIVRDAPNSLSFSTSTALQDIYGAGANTQKGEWYRTLDISAGAPSIQMVIDPHEHALRRRVIAPAFSQKALCYAEPLIARRASNLWHDLVGGTYYLCGGVKPLSIPESERILERMRLGIRRFSFPNGEDDIDDRIAFETIDLREAVTRFGFDFVSDLAFGKSFGMLDYIAEDDRGNEEVMEKSNRWIPGVLKSGSVFQYYSGYLPLAALLRPLMGTWAQNLFGKTARDSLRYTKLANARLAERIAQEEERRAIRIGEPERKDIFYYLLNSKNPQTGRAFTTEELQADTALLIAAGSDAVTTAICAVFFYVLQDINIWKRLAREIRAMEYIRPGLRDLSLPYLQACVEEALRLAPPKPGSLPRTVLPGGATIDGHFVPAGTTVGVSHYVLHRDPETFPSPSEFRPERWLADSVSAAQLAKQRKSFAPFGIGPMDCIGKNIAYFAIKAAVARLITNLDFKLHKGEAALGGGSEKMEKGRRDEGEFQMWDWIIGYPEGLRVDYKFVLSWERRDDCYKWEGYVPGENPPPRARGASST